MITNLRTTSCSLGAKVKSSCLSEDVQLFFFSFITAEFSFLARIFLTMCKGLFLSVLWSFFLYAVAQHLERFNPPEAGESSL